MSPTISKLASAAALVAAMFGAGAAPARADIQKNLEYTCKYPLVDEKPLSLELRSSLRTYAKVGEPQGPYAVSVVAAGLDGTAELLDVVDAHALGGSADLQISLVSGFSPAFSQQLRVPLTLAPWSRSPDGPIPDPLVFTATGATPSFILDDFEPVDIRIDGISFNLRGTDRDGVPINVRKLPTDVEGYPVVDSDGDVDTFDVSCKLRADQNPYAGWISATYTGGPQDHFDRPFPLMLNTPPSNVAGLKVDAVSDSAVTLSWTRSKDYDPADSVSYEIYRSGVKVDTITATSYTTTGLPTGTSQTFKVVATDGRNPGLSASIDVTNTPAPNQPPMQPSGLIAGAPTASSIPLTWSAATDPDAGDSVVGYNVYRAGIKVNAALVTGTSYTAEDLRWNTEYTFEVEAVDSRDAASVKRATVSARTVREPDDASRTNFVYTCKYPMVDKQPLQLALASTIPASTPTILGGAQYLVDAKITASGVEELLNMLEVDSLAVTADTRMSVALPSGFVQGNLKTPLTFDRWQRGPGEASDPLVLLGGGNTAPLWVDEYGTTDVRLDTFRLSATAFGGDGAPINVRKLVTDFDGNPVVDFDGDSKTFDIYCKLNAGQVARLASIQVGGDPCNCPPVKVTGLKADQTTQSTVSLSWTPSTDANGDRVAYDVYRDGVKLTSTPITSTSFTATGLVRDRAYAFDVEVAGVTASKTSITASTQTLPQPKTLEYALKGSTSLKTLTTGTLPLAGAIKAQLEIATGKFTADLTLNNAQGRLLAAGFLPLTAKVGFVPVGKTTGVLDDATATKPQSITTNSKVRIKVLEVKLFGAIPLAGGNSCQTKSLSDISLKSTTAFDPLKGGTVAGTYAISDLNGCGPLNGLVSPLTAGGGNSLSLNLTTKP